MKKTCRIATLGLLFALTLQGVWAQSASGRGIKNNSNVYSGGGIRGAGSEAPDGWLVSPAEAIEFQGEQGFNETPMLRPRSVVPLIDILKPQPAADLKVKAPFAISVLFKSQNDAAINPDTFKVMYGALKIDITNRITKFVKVGREGFSLDNAQIPPGKHRLILQVQDDKQRVAERELRVEVE